MEKNTFILFAPSSWPAPIKKIIMIINFTTLLMIITLLQVSADGFSQITLNEKNASLEKVFKNIESQSDYVFFLKDNNLKSQSVDVKVSNVSIEAALNACFKDLAVNYKIIDKTVVVKNKIVSQLAEEIITENQTVQVIDVSGTVVDNNGNKLAGVSIIIKGTNIGTTTNLNGQYALRVPNENVSLVFSYLGFISQEIALAGRATVNVEMLEESTGLSEVVVTALGITRETRTLGYSTTTVNTDELTEARTNNVGNSLQGKVAGLNVSAPATGPGGSSKIRIRGQSSFGGDNSPLIIVNGVPINSSALSGGGGTGSATADNGDGLQNINPEDIASMTVLKGAAAAALYGFRAKDGAIIITTKSGSRKSGLGIEVSSNFQAAEALDYTDFQYEYGMGEYGHRAKTVAEARNFGTFNFGEKLDGVPTVGVDGLLHPYVAHKNRIKDFFDTGTSFTNTVAVSGGNEDGNFRLSFSNTKSNSIVPNSSYNSKILNLGLNHNFTEKLSIQLNANYSNDHNKNPPVVGQQESNINSTLYTMANSIDIKNLKNNYQTPEGNELTISRFLPRTNPYWLVNKREENSRRDRLFGNASVRYEFAPWLYAQARIGQDYFTRPYDFNRPTGTGYLSAAAVGFNGNYYSSISTFRERNMDFLIGVNKSFNDYGVNITFGGNALDQTSTSIGTGVSDFYVRDLYSIANGINKNPNQGYSKKKVNSLYASLDFSYRDYLYLSVTGRNDWFSTLNPKSNNYLYPSVSTSYVFTDSNRGSGSQFSWLNFGKLRLAYAEVGGDTNPYSNNLFYSINSNTFNGIGLGQISGSNAPNANLRPLKIKESEAGLELRAFNNRASLDFAVYRKNTVDEILDVSVSNSSGYSTTKVNVGSLRNEGVEGLLTIVPVKKDGFTWETGFNASYNRSEVLSLAQDQSILYKNSASDFIGRVAHEVGKPLASLRWFDYKRDDQGRILTNNGLFQQGKEITYGSAIPTWTGGWLNTINFKGFRVFAQIDFKAGHKLISSSNYNMMRHGLHKGSLVGREGGVVFPGVNADGSPNTNAVEAEIFYTQYRTANVGTPFVYDAAFVRFRTLSVGYDLSKYFNTTFFKGVNVNAFVNNLWLMKKYVDNIDPETQYSISDDVTGLENHALPTTRNYGLNLQFKF